MFPPLPPIIVRNVVYPLYRGFRGDTLIAALEELEKNQWLPPRELEDLSQRRLEALVAYSALHVPYYRDAFRQANLKPEDIQSPADFEKLPFLTKDAIRGAGSRLVSQDPLRKGFASIAGGSTGEPTSFYGDVAAGPIRRANTMRGYRWMGVDIGDRQAVFWGVHLDAPLRERAVSAVKNYFSNTVLFSTFEMSDQSMARCASRLRRYKPRLITGYPSALALFAGFCQSRRIVDIRPHAVISSGEELYESQRELIEAVFGCRVFDRYGRREFAAVAQECDEHRGLHVMNDLFHVEIIAADGKRANEGEVGEVVVTDLSNYYMPFIRYRTGDLAVSTGRICRCGRGLPLLDRVEGRTFDTIVTTEGKHVGGFFWTWLSRAVPGIRRFQIEQRERSGIVFKFVPGPEWRAESERELEKRIRETCGDGFRVTFAPVDEIPLTASGKSKFIVSSIGERLVAKSKIHRATITGEFPEKPDGIVIDAALMELSSVSAGEKVLIVDMTNGERVDTFAVPGPKDSGTIASSGAAAKRIRTGDTVSIMAFTWAEGPLERFSNILVDDANRFVRYLTEIAGERI